jgi:aspartyl-tRNA(Asn)/glutamyl-tRNA(Gln) amidotransferase subunit C
MSVDKNTVARIARLARIEVPEGDLDHLAGELNGILTWIEQLQAVNTDGVEPMTSVVAASLPRRRDAVTDGGIRDDLMANAPDPHDGFFTVPKVVE